MVAVVIEMIQRHWILLEWYLHVIESSENIVQPCYKCGRHICIYCGDEVKPIPGRSNGEFSAHNEKGKEPREGSYDAHFGWAPRNKRDKKTTKQRVYS